VIPAIVAGVSAHVQVFSDGEFGEDAAALGHHGHALVDNFVRLAVSQVLTFEENLALAGLE